MRSVTIKKQTKKVKIEGKEIKEEIEERHEKSLKRVRRKKT
jgi:hypothetical protein